MDGSLPGGVDPADGNNTSAMRLEEAKSVDEEEAMTKSQSGHQQPFSTTSNVDEGTRSTSPKQANPKGKEAASMNQTITDYTQ